MTSYINSKDNAPITIYSKEQCSYCTKAKSLCHELGLAFKEFTLNPTDKNYILAVNLLKKQTGGHKTFPFIFIGKESKTQFLGGHDDLVHASCTNLSERLRNVGINFENEFKEDF